MVFYCNKNCVDFFFIRFNLVFRYIVYRFAIKSFLKNISDFISNFKIFSICTHFWKNHAWEFKIFNIFVANRILKTFFTKRKLAIYYYFINVYIIYKNWVFVLVKFVVFNFNIPKRYDFFTHLIWGNKFLYFLKISIFSVK